MDYRKLDQLIRQYTQLAYPDDMADMTDDDLARNAHRAKVTAMEIVDQMVLGGLYDEIRYRAQGATAS